MSTGTVPAAAAVPEKPAHLDPSELGTREYWDNLYKTEITNHAHNPSDEGTVWFDDSDAQSKMVEFLDDEFVESGRIDKASARVIDLGCGNGSMLFALREEGWGGRLLGVDYSDQSVVFARQVQSTRREHEDEEWRDVEFRGWDVLNGELVDLVGEGEGDGGVEWDVVLDKGTFDAISLSSEVRESDGKPISEGYGERVVGLMKEGGIFLVTSCNWTEGELKAWFEADEYEEGGRRMRLRQVGRVEYPSFSFGGVKGSTISTLCFVKEVV